MNNEVSRSKNVDISDLVGEEEISKISPLQKLDFEVAFELFDLARELNLEVCQTKIIFDAYNSIRQYGVQGWSVISRSISEHVSTPIDHGRWYGSTHDYIKNRLFEIMGYTIITNPEEDESKIQIQPIPDKKQRINFDEVNIRLQNASAFTGWNISHGSMPTEEGDLYIEEIVPAIITAEKLAEGDTSKVIPLLELYNEAKTGKWDSHYINSRLKEIGINPNFVNDATELIQFEIYRAEIGTIQGTHPHHFSDPVKRTVEKLIGRFPNCDELTAKNYLALFEPKK